MTIKTYSELIKFPTFEERYRYLKLNGKVGEATFGFKDGSIKNLSFR